MVTEGGQVFEISNIYGCLLSSKFALKKGQLLIGTTLFNLQNFSAYFFAFTWH